VLRSHLRFAQTYTSCIDQPCIRLLFALSAANAYANAPSPCQPICTRFDDAYADWYRSRHGKDADRSLVLPAPKASQEQPDKRSIYRGRVDKEVVLSRQVDDLADDRSDSTVTQSLSDFIATVLVAKIVDELAFACSDPTMTQCLSDFIAAVLVATMDSAPSVHRELLPIGLLFLVQDDGRLIGENDR
jgi:hypothetical protein